MTLASVWRDGLAAIGRSDFVRGAFSILVVLIVVFTLIALLFLLTYILRKFVHRDPIIDRTHRTLIYLLTMGGAVTLILAGFLGVFLPILPGIVLVVAGLLLLRRYHRWQWLETRITRLKEKVHVQREMYRIRRERRRREKAAGRSGKEDDVRRNY